MIFHPEVPSILFAYEEVSKEILVLNLENYRIFSIQTPDYINCISVPNKDTLLVGSALEGSYQILDNLSEFLKPIFTADQSGLSKARFTYIFKEQLLARPVEQDTIFTTSHMQWKNIHYLTCFSISRNPSAQ